MTRQSLKKYRKNLLQHDLLQKVITTLVIIFNAFIYYNLNKIAILLLHIMIIQMIIITNI